MQQEHDRERYVPLARTFHALTATGDEEDPWSGLSSLGGTTWADLLAKPRVLLLSEAGSGKTREVESTASELRAAGKTAFFLRLEFIKDALEDAFEVGSYEEFQAWLASPSEEAWLFLDSIDEAKLGSPLDFQLAIRKIGGRIRAAKDRTHVVLTGRMFAWQPTTDLAFCQTHLGYTPRAKAAADGNDDETNGTTSIKVARAQARTPDFEVFALDNLNADQVAKLAVARGVTDTEAFLAEIERADAWSFASRPQDLQELSDFWLDNGRIGTRSEIVSNNIARRLQERDPARAQIRPIAADKVRQGACVLAAATTLMQVQTLRVPDAVGGLPGIDLRDILPDWDDKDHLALLSRPIFDAPIYGAQRFHHRSVREFLAAEWFAGLLGNKTSRRNIENLFFKEQYGIQIVVPSLRPLLPWLILLDPPMLERVRLVAPEIVFEGGDPAALPFEVRRQILREVCEQMAGGSVGRSMRDVSAVQRFAGPDLSDEIRELLVLYAGNPDLRAFLLRMVWLGKIESLRAEVLALAVTPTLERYERITAIRAVEAVGHPGDMEQIRSAFADEAAPLSRQWLTEIVDGSEVSEAVISWLAQCLEKAEVPSKHAYDQLPSSMENLIDRSPADLLPRFVEVFDRLMSRPPLIERRFCEISEVFEWLIEPAACVIKRLVDERNPAIFEEPSLFLLQKLSTGHSYGRNRTDEKIPAIQSAVRSWPELNRALFWFEVQQCRATTLERDNDSVTHYWPAIFRSFCAFDVQDLIMSPVR